MSSTHQFQKHNFLFAIGYRNNKNTGPNHSFLWENPWQSAFRQEHIERFLLQPCAAGLLFFFALGWLFVFWVFFPFRNCITEDGEVLGFFFHSTYETQGIRHAATSTDALCHTAFRTVNLSSSHQMPLLGGCADRASFLPLPKRKQRPPGKRINRK